MLTLIAVLLALVPTLAIIYPFFRHRKSTVALEDESSPRVELTRRLEAALAGLRSAELEMSIGTLTEEDYQWIRTQYMDDAATILKTLELAEQEQVEFMTQIQLDLQKVREELSVRTKRIKTPEGNIGEPVDE